MRNLILFTLIIFGCEIKNQTSKIDGTDTLEADSTIVDFEPSMTEKPNKVYSKVYETDEVQVIADSTECGNGILYTRIKFEPFISFEDFVTSKPKSYSKAPVDLKSNRTAQRFKTVISECHSALDEINFSSYYSFVWWGCGTSCQSSAIIDWRDGKVYDGPVGSFGYDFRADSYMILVNPPDSSGFYDDCVYCKPQIWLWDEETKTFIEKKRK